MSQHIVCGYIHQNHIYRTWSARGGVPSRELIPILQVHILLLGTKTLIRSAQLDLCVYQILIIFAYSFIKLSIGFFLLRLADRTKWRPFLIGVLGEQLQYWQAKSMTNLTSSLHRLLHGRLNFRHHLSVHSCGRRVGLHFATANGVCSNHPKTNGPEADRHTVPVHATTQQSSRTSESSIPRSTSQLTSSLRSSQYLWSGNSRSTSKRVSVSP